jgi:hypothetical protein
MNPTRKRNRFEHKCPEVSIGQYTDDMWNSPFLFLLDIAMHFHLRFMASMYPFGIFKLSVPMSDFSDVKPNLVSYQIPSWLFWYLVIIIFIALLISRVISTFVYMYKVMNPLSRYCNTFTIFIAIFNTHVQTPSTNKTKLQILTYVYNMTYNHIYLYIYILLFEQSIGVYYYLSI